MINAHPLTKNEKKTEHFPYAVESSLAFQGMEDIALNEWQMAV